MDKYTIDWSRVPTSYTITVNGNTTSWVITAPLTSQDQEIENKLQTGIFTDAMELIQRIKNAKQ